MRIDQVTTSRRRKGFEVFVPGNTFFFPFSKCVPPPSAIDPVIEVFVDDELGNEAITYKLRSGKEGSVHIEQFLDYNKDPSYLRDSLVYELTLEAQKRVSESPLSKREIIRRLGTSSTQLYRLLDQTNYTKSVDQLLRLLNVLKCDVQILVQEKAS